MFVLCKTKGCRNAGLKGDPCRGETSVPRTRALGLCETLAAQRAASAYKCGEGRGGRSLPALGLRWLRRARRRWDAAERLLRPACTLPCSGGVPFKPPPGAIVASGAAVERGGPTQGLGAVGLGEKGAGRWDFAPAWGQSPSCPHGTGWAAWQGKTGRRGGSPGTCWGAGAAAVGAPGRAGT